MLKTITAAALLLLALASVASAQRGSRQDAIDDIEAFRNMPPTTPSPWVIENMRRWRNTHWELTNKRGGVLATYPTQQECKNEILVSDYSKPPQLRCVERPRE